MESFDVTEEGCFAWEGVCREMAAAAAARAFSPELAARVLGPEVAVVDRNARIGALDDEAGINADDDFEATVDVDATADVDDALPLHLHLRASLQLHGFSSASTLCLASAANAPTAQFPCSTSRSPLGSAGAIGIYRGLPDADAGASSVRASGSSVGGQLHFECSFLVLRSSRHLVHCDTGRPFFFTSKSGRSVW